MGLSKRTCARHVTLMYTVSFILCSIQHVTGGSTSAPAQIANHTQTNQGNNYIVMMLHNLMKSNPNITQTLEGIIEAAKQYNTTVVGGNNTATVGNGMDLQTMLLSTLMQALTNWNPAGSNSSGTGATAGVLGEAMKNLFLKTLVEITMGEIAKARSKANDTNGWKPPTSLDELLGMVSPVMILQRALASHSARQLLPKVKVSDTTDQCYDDVVDTLDSLVAQKMWAINMFDATGKLEGGVARGHFYFIGSYDECTAAAPSIAKGDIIGNVTQAQGRAFGTRYCRVDIKIDKSIIAKLNVDTRGVPLKLTWGLCVPDSCHRADVNSLLSIGNLSLGNVYCYEDKNVADDSSAIVAIVILSIFAALVVFGTVYDVVCSTLQTAESVEPKPTTSDSSPGKYTPAPTVTAVIDKQCNSSSEDIPLGYMPHKEDNYSRLYDSKSTPVKSDEAKTSTNETAVAMETKPITTKRPESLVGQILRSFSLYTNVPKILQAKSNPAAVSCIHGIRFFSMTWVVLGHTYNYGIIAGSETFNTVNMLDFLSVIQRFTYQTVIAGGFSVDTFFVLSAFLVTWLQLKATDKKKKKCTVRDGVMYYFHRFWRLTPIYMMVIMAWSCLYRYLGDGPLWPSTIESAEVCKKNWWTNLLYVNNLVHTHEQCLGHAWYLANDMQFYVVSPIFLITMYMFPVVGVGLTLLLLGVGIGTTLWQEYVYHGNFFTMVSDGGNYWRHVYTTPWCRVGCWAVGMLLGFIVYKRGRRHLKNKMILVLGWLVAAGTALFIVYIPYTENKEGGTPWSYTDRAFYEGLGRPAWGACMAWVIFACYYGGGGIVNSFLSWNGFIPLSRLTYSAYLVHPMCMMVNVFSRRTLLYINDYSIIYLFLGHLCMTYMVAFVCSLTFEAPFMALEKILFGRRSR